MTEITDNNEIPKLDGMPEALRRFILHWGDMGGTWGVNRTVAQIHALLYVSEHPLHAEQIADCLGVARSNVSNSLKELLKIKIIERVPMTGDRRDFYAADTDVWAIAKKVAAIRKEREIDPALETLRQCLEAADEDKAVSKEQRKRLQEMQEFTSTIGGWYEEMSKLPPSTLSHLVSMGDRVVSLLKITRKKTSGKSKKDS